MALAVLRSRAEGPGEDTHTDLGEHWRSSMAEIKEVIATDIAMMGISHRDQRKGRGADFYEQRFARAVMAWAATQDSEVTAEIRSPPRSALYRTVHITSWSYGNIKLSCGGYQPCGRPAS